MVRHAYVPSDRNPVLQLTTRNGRIKLPIADHVRRCFQMPPAELFLKYSGPGQHGSTGGLTVTACYAKR